MNEQINYNHLRALTSNNQDYQQTQNPNNIYSNSTTLSQPSADTTEFSSKKATKTRNWILAGVGATALAIIFRKNISKFADDIFKGAKNADDVAKSGDETAKALETAGKNADEIKVTFKGELDDQAQKAMDFHNNALEELEKSGLTKEQVKNINNALSIDGEYQTVDSFITKDDLDIIKHLSKNDTEFQKSLKASDSFDFDLHINDIKDYVRNGGKLSNDIDTNKIYISNRNRLNINDTVFSNIDNTKVQKQSDTVELMTEGAQSSHVTVNNKHFSNKNGEVTTIFDDAKNNVELRDTFNSRTIRYSKNTDAASDVIETFNVQRGFNNFIFTNKKSGYSLTLTNFGNIDRTIMFDNSGNFTKALLKNKEAAVDPTKAQKIINELNIEEIANPGSNRSTTLMNQLVDLFK